MNQIKQREGVPVIELSRKETRNKCRECPVCGPLTRKEHCITMICEECGLIIDRT
ncbi:MAG: hypothetical protein QXX98_03835 [Thermoplasmata archaeon]